MHHLTLFIILQIAHRQSGRPYQKAALTLIYICIQLNHTSTWSDVDLNRLFDNMECTCVSIDYLIKYWINIYIYALPSMTQQKCSHKRKFEQPRTCKLHKYVWINVDCGTLTKIWNSHIYILMVHTHIYININERKQKQVGVAALKVSVGTNVMMTLTAVSVWCFQGSGGCCCVPKLAKSTLSPIVFCLWAMHVTPKFKASVYCYAYNFRGKRRLS